MTQKKKRSTNQRESDERGEGGDQLVTDNLKLVHYIVRKFEKDASSQTYQDLYSEGVTGLIEAAQRYVPGRAKFTTYAYTRVNGAILNYLRLRSTLLRVPKSATDNGVRINISSLSAKEDAAQQQVDLPIVEQCFSFVELLEDIKNALTEQEFRIVMLKYEGYAQIEISKFLNLSENSISRIMSVIRQKLRVMLVQR